MIAPRRDYTHAKCVQCGVALCSLHQWRMGIRPEGRKPHVGHGLCIADYSALRRGAPKSPGRPRRGRDWWTSEQMLDEYIRVRDDVRNIRQAADRMGISFSRLDTALYRARKRGDQRGNAPISQIHRAIRRGSSLPIAHQEAS